MKDSLAMRRRSGLLLLAVLAACGGDEAADGTTTTTAPPATTATTEATTTSTTTAPTLPTPTTTYAQADDPPELLQTGEDFRAIVESVLAFSEWLGVHPDPSLVATYAKEGSTAWQRTSDLMSALAENELHADGVDPAYMTDSRVIDRPTDQLVVVYVAAVNPAYDLLRADGSTAESFEATPETGFAWHLERQPDGRWLLTQRDELGIAE